MYAIIDTKTGLWLNYHSGLVKERCAAYWTDWDKQARRLRRIQRADPTVDPQRWRMRSIND